MFDVINAQANTTSTISPNHGNPKLACRKANGFDVLIFFLLNYLAHVATIVPIPGERILESILRLFSALIMPTTGVAIGVQAILSWAILAKNDLSTAARAGALYTVAYRPGRSEHSSPRQARIAARFLAGRLHGSLDLQKLYSEGFVVVKVPSCASFLELDFGRAQDDLHLLSWPAKKGVGVASNYSVSKILISLAQTLFSIFTLYRARGDQLNRYGYAAFGLTVAPFAVMSTVNLLGNLMVPTYSKLYLVESKALDIAKERGVEIVITGTVGMLDDGDPKSQIETFDEVGSFWPQPNFWEYLICTVITSIPLFINYGLSRFEGKSSSVMERVWTLLWIASCIASGILYTTMEGVRMRGDYIYGDYSFLLPLTIIIFLMTIVSLVAAVGTFAMVGKMIMEYGVCVRV
jgi:hypothetical protein